MVGKSLKKWWPVFVLPTLAAFIIGFLWPFIWGIYLSFCKFSIRILLLTPLPLIIIHSVTRICLL